MPSAPPAFACPHCREKSFRKHPVHVAAECHGAGGPMAHLYVCAACGENYLATVHVDADGSRVETWDYYLEREAGLRRVRRYEPNGRYGVVEVGQRFFVGAEAASEAAWRQALAGCREGASPLLSRTAEAPATDVLARWRVSWSAHTSTAWERAPRPHLLPAAEGGLRDHRAA